MNDPLDDATYYDVGYGKPVTTSSVNRGFGDSVPCLVPAITAGRFFFLTEFQDDPWLLIDLGRPYHISRIRLFGPAHNFTEILPLCVEFSADREVYLPLSTQHVQFGGRTSGVPATVEVPWGLTLRYVRIHVPRPTRLFLDYVEISTRIPSFTTGRLIEIVEDANGLCATYAHHQSYGFSWTFTLTLIAILESDRCGVRIGRIDFSRCLHKFKDSPGEDPYHQWFAPSGESRPLREARQPPRYLHHNVYAELDLGGLHAYVRRYFLPSPAVQDYCGGLLAKYQIRYENSIVMFYRGTDKNVEVTPIDIHEYLQIARFLRRTSLGLRLIIQTDQQQIRDAVISEIPDAVVFSELPVTDAATAVHNLDVQASFGITPGELGLRLLAITYFVSQCRFVITHTGNMGVWAAMYRGHCDGLYQACADGKWRGPMGAPLELTDFIA